MPHFLLFLLLLFAANRGLETMFSFRRVFPVSMNLRTNIIADTTHPRTIDSIASKRQVEINSLPIFVTEKLARFPGCEELSEGEIEKKNCADQKLLAYVYAHLKYPEEDKGKGIEGMAIVGFAVNEQGRLEDVELLRAPSASMGKEALRIVNSMNDLEPWTPAIQMGVVVKVRYHLPIRFQLKTP